MGHPQPTALPTAAWQFWGSFPPGHGSRAASPQVSEGRRLVPRALCRNGPCVGQRRRVTAPGSQSRNVCQEPRSARRTAPTGERRPAEHAARPRYVHTSKDVSPGTHARPPEEGGLRRPRVRTRFPRSARAEGTPAPRSAHGGHVGRRTDAAAGACSPGRTRTAGAGAPGPGRPPCRTRPALGTAVSAHVRAPRCGSRSHVRLSAPRRPRLLAGVVRWSLLHDELEPPEGPSPGLSGGLTGRPWPAPGGPRLCRPGSAVARPQLFTALQAQIAEVLVFCFVV